MKLPSPLLLSLWQPEQLDPIVRAEFEHLLTTLQTWANVVNDLIGVDPPVFSAIVNIAVTIPDATYTTVSWIAPRPLAMDPGTFHELFVFDGTTTVFLKDPGIYLAKTHLRWDDNVVGRRYLYHTFAPDLHAAVPTIHTTSQVISLLHVTPEYLEGNSFGSPSGVPLTSIVFQDSGGARAFIEGSFSVIKLA